MANGTQPGQGGGFDVRGLLADPLLNLGVGLLAASGPSTTPVSLGQALAQGVQFASQRQQEALKNDIARQQLLARRQQAQARARLGQLAPGLLAPGATPQQQQALSLLIDAAPEAAIPGLLSNLVQTRAAPADIRTMQALGIPQTPEGFRQFQALKSSANPLLTTQIQRNQLEIDKLLEERRTRVKTEAQKAATARVKFSSTVNSVRDMANQLDTLTGTFLEPGRFMSESRPALFALWDEALNTVGISDPDRRKILDARTKFVKNASDAVIKMFDRMPGQLTDARLKLLQDSLAGIQTTPAAARSILARTLQMLISEMDAAGVAIPDAERAEAQREIARLRGEGQPAPGSAPETGSAPAQPSSQSGQPTPRTFSSMQAAERALRMGRIKVGDEIIVNGRRAVVEP